MKKSFLVASILVAGIVSVSIAQSSEKNTSNDTVVKAANFNVQDTVPKKDTTTPKKDSVSVNY
jgi:hypothetical protein